MSMNRWVVVAVFASFVAACGGAQTTGSATRSAPADGYRNPAEAQRFAAMDFGVVQEVEGGYRLELRQMPCRFAEAEPFVDFERASRDECEALHQQTFYRRQQHVIVVPAGDYVISVTNVGVEYELGFWLRPAQNGETLAQGGGIANGQTRTYEVTLAPGEYWYSCPLNNTLDYTLVVE